MESTSSSNTDDNEIPVPPTSSDSAVSSVMQKGLEKVVIQTSAGLVLGGLAGIVLARGGASGMRKAFAGLGAGVGLGSAWTRTSMDLEELLADKK